MIYESIDSNRCPKVIYDKVRSRPVREDKQDERTARKDRRSVYINNRQFLSCNRGFLI